MKKVNLNLIGIVIILFSIYFTAMIFENGDKNAASMYLLIYSIPLIITSLINCGLLSIAEKKYQKKTVSISLATFLPTISLILILTKDLSLNMLGTVGLIGFGLTNIIWFFSVGSSKK